MSIYVMKIGRIQYNCNIMTERQGSLSRSNPFDSEVVADENHFGPESFSETEVTAANVAKESVVANVVLGVNEANTSHQSGFGLSTIEDLELAIETCKDLITHAAEKSEKQKMLVKKLIELRIKLHEIKEGSAEITEPEKIEADKKVDKVLGHRFIQQSKPSNNRYCEHCNSHIWVILQPGCRCKYCGYSCHVKCTYSVKRICAMEKIRDKPLFELRICPEKGLANQNYRCAECKSKISYAANDKQMEPRLCDYNGLYYCPSCHWNDEMVMPARVAHNWDFVPRKVCRASKQTIKLLIRRPLLNIESINPALFNYSEELRMIRKIRSDIMLMKCYLMCCKQASEQRLLLALRKRHHFLEEKNLYSLQDLIDLHEGTLEIELMEVMEQFTRHIKGECETCRGNGFVCELCNDKDTILYPFDDYVGVCRTCCAVSHRLCFEKVRRKCPRCERRQKRLERLSMVDEDTVEGSSTTRQRPIVPPQSSSDSSSTDESEGKKMVKRTVKSLEAFLERPQVDSSPETSGSGNPFLSPDGSTNPFEEG